MTPSEELVARLRVDAEWHRGSHRDDMARHADQAADLIESMSDVERIRAEAFEEAAKRLEREWPGPAAGIVRSLSPRRPRHPGEEQGAWEDSAFDDGFGVPQR